MRISVILALSAAAAVAASVPAEAKSSTSKKKYENRAHYSITVRKQRSFLDAGTEVKPGEKSYHDYYYMLTSRYPSYGPVNDSRDYRWPLPGPYDGPPY